MNFFSRSSSSASVFLIVLISKFCSCEQIEIEIDNKNDLRGLGKTPSVKEFLQDNCGCEPRWQCKCCINYRNEFLNIQQNFCGNVTIETKSWRMTTNLALNDAVFFTNNFSGDNIPPFCFPLLPPLPLAGCIKTNDIQQHDNNQMHACANATLNFFGFNVLNFRLGCLDFGLNGIEIVAPDHHLPEATPEISLETSDGLSQTLPPLPIETNVLCNA